MQEIVIPSLPASSERLDIYRQAKKKDFECSSIIDYCKAGWPSNPIAVQLKLRPFWKERHYLTVCDDLLLNKSRIVVPQSLRKETMEKIHNGHQGEERCCWRALTSVWWPGVTHHITQMVKQSTIYAKQAKQKKEPLMPTDLPDYPWQIVGTDLFELKGTRYLITVDYFSCYAEVTKLTFTTSSSVITALKAIFSRHGLPEVVRSDNGPQLSSHDFLRFANAYNFYHVTSSPFYPQSNGQAERTVQTVKGIIHKSTDPFMALLSYRSTPMPWCGLSPAELCMGRRIRSSVPQIKNLLAPTLTSKRKKRGAMIGDTEFMICLTFLMTREFGSNLKLRLFREELVLQLIHQDHRLLKHQLEICGGIITISALFLCHMKWKIIRSVNQGK